MNEDRDIPCTNFSCEYRKEGDERKDHPLCSGMIIYSEVTNVQVYHAKAIGGHITCDVVESLNLALSNRRISEAIAENLGVELL